MALSALDDLSVEPSNIQVAEVLGSSMEAWSSLEKWLAESAGIESWVWGTSGKKYGWDLRAKIKKRNISYMIPQHGSFLVGLVLGDSALKVVREASLSEAVTDVIGSAKRYVEGTGFRLQVSSVADLDDIKTLIRIKITH